MELLRLSKFKLQLRALIAEVRELKEREQSTKEYHQISIQKHKKTEEEFSRKINELQKELSSSQELQRRLETQVQYLQNENVLLDNRQKELKATIDCLLQSRDSFLSLYEDSTCEMRRSIEVRDKKLSVLSEKIQTHSSLFESIEKESISTKQVVDNVQRLISDKEDVVAGLKRKLDQVSSFEKDFVEKICLLEKKLRSNNEELRRKDTVIFELKEKVEAATTSNYCQPQIEELQKSLSMKEGIIQNLNTEKKALFFEARALEIILQKIQEAVIHMNAEDQKVYLSVVNAQEECPTMSEERNDRSNGMVQESKEGSPASNTGQGATENTGSPLCQGPISAVKNSSQEKHNSNSSTSEGKCSPSVQVHHQQLESESSTTDEGIVDDPVQAR
ncbi:mitotic spindle assembly checkpoint protein MAD1-like [Papaver somniferum]|uniref:mitotic spindle assembly checkpoint protein MAD1-like n=1 Tax=Papaver somniferum TaxID=3469 RepID=UPI000E6FC32E|nr:mitotic spindle assembly checkpoint protein MAD1-like [Papaver somniferum]